MSTPEPTYEFVKGEGWVLKPRKPPRMRLRSDSLDNYPLDWNTPCTSCGRALGDHFGIFRPGGVTCMPHGADGKLFTWST